MQQIREITSTKSSNIAIRENLDPRKFSAIRYLIKIYWLLHKLRLLTRHNQESAPDPFPRERVGSGHKTMLLRPMKSSGVRFAIVLTI